MKDSTRAKNLIQEKRITKAMGGRQIVIGKLFIEAKTKITPSHEKRRLCHSGIR